MSNLGSVIINSRKMDGSVSRSWRADLIEETAELFYFSGVFESEVNHPELGVIRRDTASHEYFWKDRWFSVFRFYEPEGDLRNFYCNVNLPPKLADGVLDFIDLDLDMLVWKDLSFEVLDRHEFVRNAEKYSYSAEIISGTVRAIDELMKLVASRSFPFDAALPVPARSN